MPEPPGRDLHISAFRQPAIARGLLQRLREAAETLERPIRLMEVCGTHTMAIYRSGIRSVLPESVRLISGPGCPVCVSGARYVEQALHLARQPEVIICTFGDMMRVPGASGSLQTARAAGADVRIVYSPLDALQIARDNPERTVIFLAVGFETTAPGIGATVLQAAQHGIHNFLLHGALKTIPEAMLLLVSDPDLGIDGFLCPGHVSVIIGSDAYAEIVRRAGASCVIAGFEPLDILAGLLELTRHCAAGAPALRNLYPRAVRPEGNPRAQAILEQVFEPCTAEWRGIGSIPHSGLKLNSSFARFDATSRFDLDIPAPPEAKGCRCGDVLKGICLPEDCPLMGAHCSPANPIGACMVSSEGSCAAYYRYAYRERTTTRRADRAQDQAPGAQRPAAKTSAQPQPAQGN
jgi:hydrogenase expression/formation protein HypD